MYWPYSRIHWATLWKRCKIWQTSGSQQRLNRNSRVGLPRAALTHRKIQTRSSLRTIIGWKQLIFVCGRNDHKAAWNATWGLCFFFKHPLTSLPNNKEIVTPARQHQKSLQYHISPFFIFTGTSTDKTLIFPVIHVKKLYHTLPHNQWKWEEKHTTVFERISTSFSLLRFKAVYKTRCQHYLL